MKLSIVIGALKEEKRLRKSLQQLSRFLLKENLLDVTEIIIVAADGGDNTIKIAYECKIMFKNFKVIEPGEPVGKGRDIKIGVLSAKGDTILFMDADLATPLKYILQMLELIKSSDLVIGIRDLKTIHPSFVRRAISQFGNFCFYIVSSKYISDTQCGFKAFSKKSANVCFGMQTRNDWSFDMELLIIATENNFNISMIDILEWKDVPGGTFRPSPKHNFIFLLDLIIMFYNRIRHKYVAK